MAVQAVLEERIERLQNDVTELRKDGRRLDDKIGGARAGREISPRRAAARIDRLSTASCTAR